MTSIMQLLGKKGYRSKEQQNEIENAILDVWRDNPDPKTFIEVIVLLKLEFPPKKKTRKRSPYRGTISRYLNRMAKEKKLIRDGKGRGATYRPNSAKIMSLNHSEYYKEKLALAEGNNSYQLLNYGVFDISLLGIPPEAQLNEEEKRILRKLINELSDVWISFNTLKYNIALRQKGIGRIARYGNSSVENVIDDLFKQRENLALLVTHSMVESREYASCIENTILSRFEYIVQNASRFNYNKYQELAELVYDIFEHVFSVLPTFTGKFPLSDEEKQRVLDMKPLLKRYDKQGIDIIVEVLEKILRKYAVIRREGNEAADVYKYMCKALKNRGLYQKFTTISF